MEFKSKQTSHRIQRLSNAEGDVLSVSSSIHPADDQLNVIELSQIDPQIESHSQQVMAASSGTEQQFLAQHAEDKKLKLMSQSRGLNGGGGGATPATGGATSTISQSTALPAKAIEIKQYAHFQQESKITKAFPVFQTTLSKVIEYFLYIATCGIFFVILSIKPKWRYKIFFTIVSASDSIGVAIYGPSNDFSLCYYLKSFDSIQTANLKKRSRKVKITSDIFNPNNEKVFEYRFQRYVLRSKDYSTDLSNLQTAAALIGAPNHVPHHIHSNNSTTHNSYFEPYLDNPFNMTLTSIIELSSRTKVSSEDVGLSRSRNGFNQTDVPDKGLVHLMLSEFLSPFYFFQIFSLLLWSYEEYYIYMYVIAFMVVLSYSTVVFSERSSFLRLKRFSYLRKDVVVLRGGTRHSFTNEQIIVGDNVIINKGDTVTCDLIVIQGSVVVNEAMLTGDCIPAVKSAVNINDPHELFTEKKHCIIYSGSEILQISNVKCVALRVGFETLRGNMIRSILYPMKTSSMSFSRDVMYFILMLGIAAFISFFVTLDKFLNKLNNNLIEPIDMVVRCLDLITISVPPALPICLSFGLSFSIRRLRLQQIFCMNSQNINLCGILRMICFDKTGTLTESILNFKMLSEFDAQTQTFEDHEDSTDLSVMPNLIMGACHSLKMYNNTCVGDPLDQEMFKKSNWRILNSTEDDLQRRGEGVIQEITHKTNTNDTISVLKVFPFESHTERMSTIVRYDGITYLLTKGSPEKIYSICRKESLPQMTHSTVDLTANINNYDSKYKTFTKYGYRVITLCFKPIDSYLIGKHRAKLEKNMTFAGFLVFENQLKPETFDHLKLLRQAQVHVVMVTGDHPQTSVNIAKQCHILSSTGTAGSSSNSNRKMQQNHELQPQQQQLQKRNTNNKYDRNSSNLFDQSPKELQAANVSICDYQNNEITIESTDSQLSTVPDIDSLLKSSSNDLVVTGRFFSKFFNDAPPADSIESVDLQQKQMQADQLHRLLVQTKVFARMQSEQKQTLVRLLQTYANPKHYTFVGVCGDGANDCQALKYANVGISLGEAEASMAGTILSKIDNISVIEFILREGRCCLQTFYQCFKFMGMYSLIQVTTTAIMYYRGVIPSNYQFLFWDLFIVLPLAFLLGITSSANKLSEKTPLHRLFSVENIVSVIGLAIIQVGFLVLATGLTMNQSWYVDPLRYEELIQWDPTELLMHSFDNTVLFWMANGQYIGSLICFLIKAEHQKSFLTNIALSTYLVLIVAFSAYLQFTTQWEIVDLFEIYPQLTSDTTGEVIAEMQYEWRFYILVLLAANFFINLVYEKVVVKIIVNAINRRFTKYPYTGTFTTGENPESKNNQHPATTTAAAAVGAQ